MKKLISFLVLAAMLSTSLLTGAIADEAFLLWEEDYINTIGEETQYVEFRDYRNGNGYGLCTMDGTVVIPGQYRDLSFASLEYLGFFTVANENSTNNLSLINLDNKVLTETLYGEINIVSNDWFIGVVLEQTYGADYDYSNWFGDDKYIVARYDVYYIPAGKKVGSLQRGQCHNSKAFGEYLLISDTNGNVQLYDKDFHAVNSAFSKVYDCEFYIHASGLNQSYITSRITGEKITTGYTSVSDLDGNYFSVQDSQRNYGIIDRQGNLVLDTAYEQISYSSMTGAIKIKSNGLTGLFDPESKKIVLPCEYDDIIAPDYYHINNNGYYMVEKDGKVGYVNAANKITCPLSYAKSAMTLLGCTMYAADLDGTYKLVAADGTITPLPGVTEISKHYNSPSGYYIVVKNKDNLWGIMDWHGNLVINYCVNYDSMFDFLDDTHFIYNDNSVYEIK